MSLLFLWDNIKYDLLRNISKREAIKWSGAKCSYKKMHLRRVKKFTEVKIILYVLSYKHFHKSQDIWAHNFSVVVFFLDMWLKVIYLTTEALHILFDKVIICTKIYLVKLSLYFDKGSYSGPTVSLPMFQLVLC